MLKCASSDVIFKSLPLNDEFVVLKFAYDQWTVFSLTAEPVFEFKKVGNGYARCCDVIDVLLLPAKKRAILLFIHKQELVIIDPWDTSLVQKVANKLDLLTGIYHCGLLETLLHNGKDIISLEFSKEVKLREAPWKFTLENLPLTSWSDFQSEIISNMYSIDSARSLKSSLVLLIEFKVLPTGYPILHWTTILPAENKIALSWRLPLSAPDSAITLFFDSQGVETCLAFSGGIMFVGNTLGLTHSFEWQAFGSICSFETIHVTGEKCFFLAAYDTGGMHGNELDLHEGTVSVSPVEGVTVFSSVSFPIIRRFESIVSQNWKIPNFHLFAFIGDPNVGYSFVYTDSFAAAVSPEILASLSRIFDCASHIQSIVVPHCQSSFFHSTHKLLRSNNEVLQTVRFVHPLQLTGSFLLESLSLADFQLLPMEAVPSLCQSGDALFVLTSRSFRCSVLLKLRNQSPNEFEAISGILVENDETLAVCKLSDRRVVQITPRQVNCFTINAAKQWILETKIDIAYSAQQYWKASDRQISSKILFAAQYRNNLWLACDGNYIAQLSLSQLPIVDIRFDEIAPNHAQNSQEISAVHSITYATTDWLVFSFWESNTIKLQQCNSSGSKEATGEISLPPTTTTGGNTVRQMRLLSFPSKKYLILAVSQSQGQFYLYALFCDDNQQIKTVRILSFILDGYSIEIAQISEQYLLVRTVTEKQYEIQFLWTINYISTEKAVGSQPYPDSVSLFAMLQQFNTDNLPQFPFRIRTFGGVSCRSFSALTHVQTDSHFGKETCSFLALASPESLSVIDSHNFQESNGEGSSNSLQQRQLQQLLVIRGELDMSSVCWQSLAVSERYASITDTCTLDASSQQMLVLHWTHMHAHQSHSDSNAMGPISKQGIDVLNSTTLERLRSISFDFPFLNSKSSSSLSPPLGWSMEMCVLLNQAGFVQHLSRVPIAHWWRDKAFIARHLQFLGVPKHDLTPSQLSQLKPVTLVVIESARSQASQSDSTANNTAENDDNDENSESDSDSDYDDPALKQADQTTLTSDSAQANAQPARNRKRSYTTSRYDSNVHIISCLLFPEDDALSWSRISATSGNRIADMPLIPLSNTQWTLPGCDLYRHAPCCAEISSTTSAAAGLMAAKEEHREGFIEQYLAVLTIEGTLSVVGWAVSLSPQVTSSATSSEVSIEALSKEPLRKGNILLKRLTSISSSLQPMIPAKFEVDYSDPERALRDLKRLADERQWRKKAKPQLICRENVAVVYVPRVGFEIFRLRSSLAEQNEGAQPEVSSTYEIEMCAVIKDMIDFEQLFVVTQSNVQGDIVVKIFGHDRMMARNGHADRALRLHSFILSSDTHYHCTSTVPTLVVSAERRDSFCPLPGPQQSDEPYWGLDSVLSESRQSPPERLTSTMAGMSFAEFADCMDVQQLLQQCTVMHNNGDMQFPTWSTSLSL